MSNFTFTLRHHQAHSQNKGLSRASRLRTGLSPAREAGEGSQSWKGAIAAPERHHLPNCKQASLLTKTSWGSGQLAFAGRVAARDQLPRRDTQPTRECVTVVHPENGVAGTGEAISHSPGGHLSCSNQGRAENTGPSPAGDRQLGAAIPRRGQSWPQRDITYQTANRLHC